MSGVYSEALGCNLVLRNPHAKPYFLFESHLVNCVALNECNVVDTSESEGRGSFQIQTV